VIFERFHVPGLSQYSYIVGQGGDVAVIPGAYNIGAGPNLSTWAAWVLPYDRPILLIGDVHTDIDAARRSLIRVGLDTTVGSLRGGTSAWLESGRPQAHVPQISVLDLQQSLREGNINLLDVRSPAEWQTGHILSAVPIPGGTLPRRLRAVPTSGPLHVICGSGYRSSVAISVLLRAGYTEVTNVAGGMNAWRKQHLPESAT
jgi:hydroxyacylglutathione hydrolase